MEIAVKKIQGHFNKPTIIFLHDSFGCIELWKDFPEKVEKVTGCTVFSYDRIGYGKSSSMIGSKRDKNYLEKEADILNELLKKWQLSRVILFGHSDGGSIALLTAAKYSEKILGVITVGAHVFMEERTRVGVKEAVDEYINGNLKKKLERYHGEKTDAVFWS